ncbi:glutamine amidotransferase, class I [Luminiphilus syltensis NOR5-1B]|uniref:Glutamine amidotransferase, class I n=1 Tax=Luminiphilus syltensis NOR5-1B TaxID=565045 RepID=B8KU21_9GAMM|nr:glutamine amidotransferase [Luminiphilus syltensis]EED36636.1 glutamine amidotransferase, class I [Luminiphilus syltensis NOR5-1B]
MPRSTKPFLIIQPATSFDDVPALCAFRGDEVRWFSEKMALSDRDITAVKVYQGESLPDPRNVQGAIITGAIDMVTDGHQWIETAAQWVREAIVAETPVLGVCFGHQLIAHAMGGRVGENPRGSKFGKITLRNRAVDTDDPIFQALPKVLEMKVFHQQSVLELPADVVVLAESDHDPFQAVRYAETVWGVQFHPEFDSEIMAYSYDVYEDMITSEGFSVPDLRAQAFSDKDGAALLARFVEYARQRDSGDGAVN